MSSNLTFAYKFSGDPDDDFGRFEMHVVTERRSGSGAFWVQWQDVKEFGQTLGTYPIDANNPLSAR